MSMTVRERLIAALTAGAPDRTPVTLYGVFPHNPDDWRWTRPSYHPLLHFAREHTDPFCRWEPAKPAFYATAPSHSRLLDDGAFIEHTLETPLGPITTVTNHTPATQWTEKYYCETDEDVERFLSISFEPARPDLSKALELERTIGDDALLTIGFLDPIALVGDLFGPEEFAIRCVTDTRTVKQMMDMVFENVYDFLHYLLDHGPRAHFIIAGAEYATAPLLAPRYFDEFVVPYESRMIDLIRSHGSWATVHCHGRLDGVLERIAGMGPHGLHPVEAPPMGDVSLADVKRRVGERMCLIGNIQIGDVIGATEEEIDQAVRAALRDGAPGGGFILSVTASPYEEELSLRALRNYQRIVESARAHR
jgi:hypothetical protein